MADIKLSVDLSALEAKIASLEKEIATLKSVKPSAAIVDTTGEFEVLTVKGKSAPPRLNIVDPFGRVNRFSNEQGHTTIELISKPDASLRIKNVAMEDVFTFNQDGTIKLNKLARVIGETSINPIKDYYIPIFDEVGLSTLIKVKGSNLINTIR